MKKIKIEKECPCNDKKFTIQYQIDEDDEKERSFFCPFCAYPLDEDLSFSTDSGLYGLDEDLS